MRFALITLVVYAGILAFGLNEFRKTPVGFIPQLDRGYLIVVVQLPSGASLSRTDEVNRRAVELAMQVPGVAGAVNVVGFSGATFTVAPNAGAIFAVLEPFEQRAGIRTNRPIPSSASSTPSCRHPGGADPGRAAAARCRASAMPAASA